MFVCLSVLLQTLTTIISVAYNFGMIMDSTRGLDLTRAFEAHFQGTMLLIYQER